LGYQAAERGWRQKGVAIRAALRDTTIEGFEGCLTGDLPAGPCRPTGQRLIRIGPPAPPRDARPAAGS
jgi:hypothetical protein